MLTFVEKAYRKNQMCEIITHGLYPPRWVFTALPATGVALRGTLAGLGGQEAQRLTTRFPDHVHHPLKCTIVPAHNSPTLNNHKMVNE